ncbi:hypothetical protein [Histophilus somni]|uniref:hypothetical protein n=1 Tax=Histophilus somni TaxID=731 RepID=UPI00201E7FCB|nr:hypothetical protein [Histophilus somni]
MSNRIEITVNIYKNYFGDTSDSPYVYDNIKAINPNEQKEVDEIVNKMIANGSPQLFEPDLNILNPITPLETGRKCFLNLQTLCIEFK